MNVPNPPTSRPTTTRALTGTSQSIPFENETDYNWTSTRSLSGTSQSIPLENETDDNWTPTRSLAGTSQPIPFENETDDNWSPTRSLLEKTFSTISTAYENGRVSFGNMLDVYAIHDVTILAFALHTDKEGSIHYEIYATNSWNTSYVESKNDLQFWGEPISSGDVASSGIGNPTLTLPFAVPIVIRANEVKGFYVTLNTTDLWYSVGKEEMIAYENFDLQLRNGVGVGHYPLSRQFPNQQDRIWQGVIYYDGPNDPTSSPTLAPSVTPSSSSSPTLAPSITPSSSPTLAPSSSPTLATSITPSSSPTLAPSSSPTLAQSSSPTLAPSSRPSFASMLPSMSPTESGMILSTITTTNYGDRLCYGNMFDVQALYKLSIQGMDIQIMNRDKVEFTIYTKRGSHVGFENSTLGWEVIANGTVWGKGQHQLTPLPAIAWQTPIRMNPNSTQAFYLLLSEKHLQYSDSTGQGPVSNSDLSVKEGTAVYSLLEEGFNDEFFRPRVWNGALHYFAKEQKKIEELTSDTKIVLAGLDSEVDFATAIFFESAARDFLNDLLLHPEGSSPPIKVTSVKIVGQKILLGNERRLVERMIKANPSHTSIELDTLVTGEYMPPPEVSFGEVVEESINFNSEALVESLKENKHFKSVRSLGATNVVKNDVKMPPPKPCGFFCRHQIIVFVLVFSAFIYLIVSCLLKRGSKQYSNERQEPNKNARPQQNYQSVPQRQSRRHQ